MCHRTPRTRTRAAPPSSSTHPAVGPRRPNMATPGTPLTATEVNTLKGWLAADAKSDLELLYSSTVHGMNAATFHQRCDGRAPTVVVVRSNTNAVFGGYTAVPWSQANAYVIDAKAFLFRLRGVNGGAAPIRSNLCSGNGQNAVHMNAGNLAVFGGGHDLCLQPNSQCSANPTSYGFSDGQPVHLGQPTVAAVDVYVVTVKELKKPVIEIPKNIKYVSRRVRALS